ncbi:MAG: mannose-1-phosphate guanylyltransferase [Oscillospiraceae bacterium]
MPTFSIILAGGSGTRFWPMSRVSLPKQVLNISGNDVMINETITRCKDIIPYKNNFIVTAASQENKIDDVMLKEVPRENIITEPCQRNTAPCILYAALKLKKLYGDGVMCVFPSDQYITDNDEFSRIMAKAVALAETSNKLITLGIKPTFPSTGYGYINFDNTENISGAFPVNEFVEKPSYDKAASYIKNGSYLWNSGIFIWKISVILENFKRYLPRIYDKMLAWYDFIGTDDEGKKLQEIYPSLQKISIDFGILERSDEVLVFPADMGWNDVGSWDALGAIFPPDEQGNIIRADENVSLDTSGCIIYSENQLVTTVGLNNMIVVSTKDALMVCPKEMAQDVKRIVEELGKRGMEKYL